jgi:hypothetical protein
MAAAAAAAAGGCASLRTSDDCLNPSNTTTSTSTKARPPGSAQSDSPPRNSWPGPVPPIIEPPAQEASDVTMDEEVGHGHFFTKKTFHKPSYCHHCTDMLWGIIRQGFVCEGKPRPHPSYRQAHSSIPKPHYCS